MMKKTIKTAAFPKNKEIDKHKKKNTININEFFFAWNGAIQSKKANSRITIIVHRKAESRIRNYNFVNDRILLSWLNVPWVS